MWSTTNVPPSPPPWLDWLPHRVEWVRDAQGRVCTLRSLDAGAPVDLELGAVIVRVQRDTPRPGAIEWTVHASATRHSHEAKAALSVIQYTLVMLEGLRKALVKAVGSDTVNRDS